MTTPDANTDETRSNALLRPLLAVFANVAVITGLLVYFGWQRSEVQARELGINESILGMSTRDYALRSVGSVFRLVLIVSLCGLVWLWLDHNLGRRVRGPGTADPVVRHAVRLLPFAAPALPLAVVLIGFAPPLATAAYVAAPLSIGAGVLLIPYAVHLRGILHGSSVLGPGREGMLRVLAGVLVCISLFWATTRYAEVAGKSLAAEFASTSDDTSVVAYSSRRLHLAAPGVQESGLTGSDDYYRFRYTGLRLLEHTGGRYFLISAGWTNDYGVVITLKDDDETVRLDFIRDRR